MEDKIIECIVMLIYYAIKIIFCVSFLIAMAL